MLVDPRWESWALQIAETDRDVPLEQLLENPILSSTMTFADEVVLAEDVAWLEDETWLDERGVLAGEPRTAAHHLYGLMRFSEITGVDWLEPQTVIEWGGGYGGMARLAQKLCTRTRWTIIDLPAMLEIQRQHCEAELVSVYALDYFDPDPPDVFVATHSLSESTVEAQDLVSGFRFYDAEHLLFAHRDHPDFPQSTHWAEIALRWAVPISSSVDGEYYGFR